MTASSRAILVLAVTLLPCVASAEDGWRPAGRSSPGATITTSWDAPAARASHFILPCDVGPRCPGGSVQVVCEPGKPYCTTKAGADETGVIVSRVGALWPPTWTIGPEITGTGESVVVGSRSPVIVGAGLPATCISHYCATSEGGWIAGGQGADAGGGTGYARAFPPSTWRAKEDWRDSGIIVTPGGVPIPLPLPPSMIPVPSSTWSLLTRANNGTVSLLRGMTKAQCEFAGKRLRGLPATPEEVEAERAQLARNGNTVTVRMLSPGDIATAECFE